MNIYKVLIAEDDPMVSMINEQYVRKNSSFRIAGKCNNGLSALDFLASNAVDLVILDVYMPKMNGFETLRKIREKNIPVDVIMVTAANDRASLEEALHLGVVDYLVKPFSYERFSAALEKFISQREMLGDMGTLNQKNIDYIMDNTRTSENEARPKGIQDNTLDKILDYLSENEGQWHTSEEIGDTIGLTKVTVRRYLNYLTSEGLVENEMDYSTGGRPSVKYRKK